MLQTDLIIKLLFLGWVVLRIILSIKKNQGMICKKRPTLINTLSSQRKFLGNGTDVGLGPRILLDIERPSKAVIISSLLEEISVGLTSPKNEKKNSRLAHWEQCCQK